MKTNVFLSLTLCLFFFSFTPTMANPFKGCTWISAKSDSIKANQWICFRKKISLDKNFCEPINMSIAVDSKYWLWINNTLVIFEGGLKRGPNPRDTYYDSIDISNHLKKGENTIALLVWYWGKDGYCHKNSGKSGLIATITSNNLSISTDSSWKACIHPAFGETGDPKPNYRLPESNIHFDARKDLVEWNSEHYNDSAWENASEVGLYPCAPWNELHLRPFPNWKDSGIKKYEAISKKEENGNLIIEAQLPHNITVTPYLKIHSNEGVLIDIRSDNYKGGSEYNVRSEYITKAGVQQFEMLNYINGHKVVYIIPKGVKVIELGYRETRFNTNHLGTFNCSDPFYNKLWKKSLNTMNLNMRDAIQDPDRERSQWWGDAAIILHEIFYTCDTNGHNAVKKAVLNLIDWQKDDGVIFSPIPAGSWDKELPQQMLAAVGKYGFWSYFWHTNDKETLHYIYPAVKRYLSLWQINEKGLVKHRSGGWDWADWGANIDTEVLDNAWLCLALESAINMAKEMEDKPFIDYYSTLLQVVKKSANEIFWQGDYYRSPNYQGKTDDRANGLALLAGWSNSEQNAKIVNLLINYEGASPYMEKYIEESLFTEGFINEGLRRMKKRYQKMVDSPITTLWEDWEIGGAGGGSINHGWAGGPLALLPQYIAGISPLKPGWEQFIIKPQLGNLDWVNCTVPIHNKCVSIEVKSNSKEWSLKVDNATGKECIVGIPRGTEQSQLLINGKSVSLWNGKPEKHNVIEYIRADQRFVYAKLLLNKMTLTITYSE